MTTWIDTPPMTSYALISSNRHQVRLEGPTPSARVVSGVSSAFGAGVAAMGLRFLRQPLPMPFKAVPILMTAVGTGLVARGAGGALYRSSIDAKKTGLLFTWGLPRVHERTLEIAWKDIEDLEINSKEVGTRDELSTLVYVLTVVRTDGSAFPIESFGTKAQANLRKKALEGAKKR